MLNLIMIHLLLVFTVFILLKVTRCKQIVLYTLVAFIIPYLGSFMIFMIQLCSCFIKKHERESILEIDKEIEVEESLLIRKAELEREVELIPIEEVLIINSNTIKRQSLINVLRDDVENYLDIVKKALKDEDTETSHYAAASITELKRKLSLLNQELSEQYQENKGSEQIVTEYLTILSRYIKSDLLDENANHRLINRYFEVYDAFFNENHSYELLKVYIELAIKIRDDSRALEYSKLFIDLYSNEVHGYRYMLEVYYNKQDYSSFKTIIQQLKHSSIIVDEQLWKFVGIWLGGELNV